MKTIFLVVSFLVLAIGCDAWVAIEPFDPEANTKSHCFSRSLETAMSKGERRQIPGQCAVAACTESRDVSIVGCIAPIVEPPCRTETVLSKPYPECCPHNNIICPQKEQ